MLAPKAALNKWHNGKSDENLRGVLLQTSPPTPNKWIKRKAALLSPLPLSVWGTLVSDESLSWPYSAGSHVTLSHRSLPQGSHRKSLFPGHYMLSISTALRWGKKCNVVKRRVRRRTVNLGTVFLSLRGSHKTWVRAKLEYFKGCFLNYFS